MFSFKYSTSFTKATLLAFDTFENILSPQKTEFIGDDLTPKEIRILFNKEKYKTKSNKILKEDLEDYLFFLEGKICRGIRVSVTYPLGIKDLRGEFKADYFDFKIWGEKILHEKDVVINWMGDSRMFNEDLKMYP